MKMLIPVVGDKIIIKKDVKLELKNTGQNERFLEKYDELLGNVKQISNKKHHIEIKKGTLLTIDRVYIRQGDSSDFDSITFKISKDKHLPNGRFFVSIDVANSLEIEWIGQEEKKDKLEPFFKKKFSEKVGFAFKNLGNIFENLNTIYPVYDVNIVFNYKNLKNEIDNLFNNYLEERFGINKIKAMEMVNEFLEKEPLRYYDRVDYRSDEIKNILDSINDTNKTLFKEINTIENKTTFNTQIINLNEKKCSTSHILKTEYIFNDLFENISYYFTQCIYISGILEHNLNHRYYDLASHHPDLEFIKYLLSNRRYTGITYALFNDAYIYKIKFYPTESLESIYMDVADIKHITFLNPNHNNSELMDRFIGFEDKDGVKSLKEVRKMITKSKKM